MIFINNLKYIKKLNKKVIDDLSFTDLKALNFTELNNSSEILSFINNCNKINKSKYNKEKIENIILNNQYLAYIYYKNDNPLGFLTSYIVEDENKKILKIENLGVLKQYNENLYESDFIKFILSKAWEKKGIDNITINFEPTENKMKKIMKKIKFKRTK